MILCLRQAQSLARFRFFVSIALVERESATGPQPENPDFGSGSEGA